MAELVGQQPLQFIAAQAIQRALRDGHDGVRLVPAGRERVDAFFTRQHHGLRRRQSGGNRQFADDIAQPAFGLAAGGPGLACAHLTRQRFTAPLQHRSFKPPAAQHKQQRHCRIDTEKIIRIAIPSGRHQPPGQRQRPIDGQHQRDDGQAKQQQQPPGLRPRFFLLFKKSHRVNPHSRSLRVVHCAQHAKRQAWGPSGYIFMRMA